MPPEKISPSRSLYYIGPSSKWKDEDGIPLLAITFCWSKADVPRPCELFVI